MLESFLILSRETLEAVLVVIIVFAYLAKTNNTHYRKNTWWGIVAGIVGSIIAAFLFIQIAGEFEGKGEQLFEGITMLIGAILLTGMIFWMMKQRNIKASLHKKLDKHLQKGVSWMSGMGIFMLVFVSLLREGVETVIYLNALKYASGINLVAGLSGVATAIFLGCMIYKGASHINLRTLFMYTSLLLILFASGLVGRSVHEFEEAGVVHGIIAPLYDLNPSVNADGSYPLLHEEGAIGRLLSGFFGYTAAPSLLEFLFYATYLVVMGYLFVRFNSQKTVVN